MAETTKVNMSKLITDAFKASPEKLKTPAKAIIAVIEKETGRQVKIPLVNMVRAKLKGRVAERKAKKAKKAVAETVTVAPVGDFEQLLAVRDFAGKVGGVEKLKTLLEQLSKLVG